LKNLSKNEVTPTETKPDAVPAEKPAVTPPGNGVFAEKLTISETDALRRQMEQCWNIPAGARDAHELIVDIYVEVNPDRTVKMAKIADTGRMSDPFYRSAAESALRAVLNPRCSPLMLPPDRYDTWRTMTLRFNPREMLGT
jgi:hypothetical protein